MSGDPTARALERLIEVRDREVEQLGLNVAQKRETRERYVRNLLRMQVLSSGTGASSQAAPTAARFTAALSMNCGQYKQSLLGAMEAHRVDLSLHDSDLGHAQRVLLEAARRRDSLDLVLRARRARASAAQERRARRHEDETSLQMWCRVHK